MAEPSAWVIRFAARIPEAGTVLDLAAGSGRHTRFLRDQGYRIVAVDIDTRGLEEFGGDARVDLVDADLEGDAWPFGETTFDGIVVTNYLHRPLLPRLTEALAPAGALIYETFAVGQEAHGRPSNPSYLLREGELLDVFDGPLEVIAYEHVHETDPRPAVRQRICAVKPGRPKLSENAAKAPDGHADAQGGAKPEQ